MPADCRHARSALQKWLESPVEIGDRATALKALAIDEERGRRVNAELLIRLSAHFLDLLMQLIVREALVKSLLGEPGLLGDLEQLGCGIVTDDPLVLLRSEEHTSELQSRENLVCRLLLEKNKEQDH